MVELKRTGLSVNAERAILLHTIIHKGSDYKKHLEELANLAVTAGATVLDTLVQRRSKIDPYYYIGKGKAKQLAGLCKERCVDVVICDDDLAPAQIRNLENILAIELLFGVQGLEFRRPAKCSHYVENVYSLIRTKVAKLENDRLIDLLKVV